MLILKSILSIFLREYLLTFRNFYDVLTIVVFFILGIAHESLKASEINKKIFETIYFGAVEASMEIAKEKGAYSSYEGSPISENKFQFDLWGVKPSKMWDWEGLREKIKNMVCEIH